ELSRVLFRSPRQLEGEAELVVGLLHVHCRHPAAARLHRQLLPERIEEPIDLGLQGGNPIQGQREEPSVSEREHFDLLRPCRSSLLIRDHFRLTTPGCDASERCATGAGRSRVNASVMPIDSRQICRLPDQFGSSERWVCRIPWTVWRPVRAYTGT